MKRLLLTAAAALVAMPVLAFSPMQVAGQSAAVAKALAAAPARNRDDATVISWNSDYTYETLKEGTNQLVCYDRSNETRRATFDVQCTNLGNLDRVAQNRRFRVESADRGEENALIAAAEAAGTRAEAVFGSLWIAMRGEDQASARTHTTIAMPFATTATTGFPENGRAGGAYIMGAGTAGAHLMTPGS